MFATVFMLEWVRFAIHPVQQSRLGIRGIDFAAREHVDVGGKIAPNVAPHHVRLPRATNRFPVPYQDNRRCIDGRRLLVGHSFTRSKSALMPWPTPMHIVTRP